MFPVLVESLNGRFEASVPGSPVLRADGATKAEAVAALRADLQARSTRGELVWIDPPTRPLTDFAGVFKDDPCLDDIVAEAYRRRDELKAQEFPE